MKHNTLFSILATAAFGIVMAGPVSASVIDWNGKGTDWATAANWVGGVVPGSGDTAKFPAVYTVGSNEPGVSTADATVGRVVLARSHTITVTGKTLTLAGTVPHDIDGDIVLSDVVNDSVLKVTGAVTMDITGNIFLKGSNAVLDLDANVTVQGAGEIKGENNAAEIQIADSSTLTNLLLIHGKMTIKESGSSGTFLNGSTGIVRADAAGTLLLAAGLTLSNCSDAVWEASSNSSAVLRFDQDATGLTGLFYLDDCAIIEVAAGVDIATTNTLTDSAGNTPAQGCVVIGTAGASFSYRDRCDGDKTTLEEDTAFGSCSCP